MHCLFSYLQGATGRGAEHLAGYAEAGTTGRGAQHFGSSPADACQLSTTGRGVEYFANLGIFLVGGSCTTLTYTAALA